MVERIILFCGVTMIVAVIGYFIYHARDIIFKKKNQPEIIKINLFNIDHSDICPICGGKMNLTKTSDYYIGNSIRVIAGKDYNYVHCEKGCFAIRKKFAANVVMFYLFGDKVYGNLWDNEIYEYQTGKTLEGKPLSNTMRDRRNIYVELVKNIEFYKQNNRYVAEWLDNNVYKIKN